MSTQHHTLKMNKRKSYFIKRAKSREKIQILKQNLSKVLCHQHSSIGNAYQLLFQYKSRAHCNYSKIIVLQSALKYHCRMTAAIDQLLQKCSSKCSHCNLLLHHCCQPLFQYNSKQYCNCSKTMVLQSAIAILLQHLCRIK